MSQSTSQEYLVHKFCHLPDRKGDYKARLERLGFPKQNDGISLDDFVHLCDSSHQSRGEMFTISPRALGLEIPPESLAWQDAFYRAAKRKCGLSLCPWYAVAELLFRGRLLSEIGDGVVFATPPPVLNNVRESYLLRCQTGGDGANSGIITLEKVDSNQPFEEVMDWFFVFYRFQPMNKPQK